MSGGGSTGRQSSRHRIESGRGVLLGSYRLRGVELPTAFLDPASPLVPGDGDADMVRASPRACSSNFLLRLAGCQGKDLIAEALRSPVAGSCSRGRATRAPA